MSPISHIYDRPLNVNNTDILNVTADEHIHDTERVQITASTNDALLSYGFLATRRCRDKLAVASILRTQSFDLM